MSLKLFLLSLIVSTSTANAAFTCNEIFNPSQPNAGTAPPRTPLDPLTHTENYRYLEEPTPERKTWLDGQNAFANRYFKTRRNAAWLQNFFTVLFEKPNDIKTYQSPTGNFNVRLIDRGLAKPVDLVINRNGRARTLFSTYQVKRNGTIGLTNFDVDPVEQNALIPFSRAGSLDSYELRIVSLETGNLRETLTNVTRESISWISETEFYYSRRMEAETHGFIHEIGTSQAQDKMVEGSTWYHSTSNKKFTVKQDPSGTSIKRMQDKNWSKVDTEVGEIMGQFENELFVKSENAIRAMQILPQKGQLKFGPSRLIVEELPNNRMESAKLSQGRLLVKYSWGKEQVLKIFSLTGKVENEIALPQSSNLAGYSVKGPNQLALTFSSPVIQFKEFKYDLQRRIYEGNRNPDIEMMTDADGIRYVTNYIKTTSGDGAQVVIRVVHREDVKLDGKNPSIMEGYGGFGASGYFKPFFNAAHAQFLKFGGVYAAPALRGGDEFGKQWREQAMGPLKQNVFNDFIASAAELHKQGYTNPKKLAVVGWSNGGLLIGAVVAQRPDLFKVGVAGAGVEDMLRKERLDPFFDEGWSYEYGKSDNSNTFRVLSRYSPIERATPAKYPTVLVMVGQNDSRVNPAHSYKLAATLQNAQRGPNPIILSATKNSGHWLTKEDLQDVIGWRSSIRVWSTVWDEVGIVVK